MSAEPVTAVHGVCGAAGCTGAARQAVSGGPALDRQPKGRLAVSSPLLRGPPRSLRRARDDDERPRSLLLPSALDSDPRARMRACAHAHALHPARTQDGLRAPEDIGEEHMEALQLAQKNAKVKKHL